MANPKEGEIFSAESEMKHAPRDVSVQIRTGYFRNAFLEV